MNKIRIRMLMPYFGKWPEFMPLYIDGCRRNPDVQFIFFTDCGVPNDIPKNVVINEMSFDEMKKMIEGKVGISVAIERPYKLCDFRPAYGDIFSEYLDCCDFWGFGDIDLIYGNIRDFASDKVLAKFDVFSERKEYISGSFCLFRNNDFINGLYKRSPD